MSFVRFCIVGLPSFSLRACIGVGSCSLLEVGLVGPETRVFRVDDLCVGALLCDCVTVVGGLEAGLFCLPWLWVLSCVRPVV